MTSNPYYFIRRQVCVYRRLQLLLLTSHFVSVMVHLFYKPIGLPVLPVLKLNSIFQPALLLAILEQIEVALKALFPAIFPELLHKPLKPLRLPVPPSSPILMLSKLRPMRPLCLKNTFSGSGDGNPIPDDISVICRLI